jgi:hypothetical protein
MKKRGQQETTMRSVILILIWLMGVSPALAERIRDDAGGLIETYAQRFSRIRMVVELADRLCQPCVTWMRSL